jgi:hypothetical protein
LREAERRAMAGTTDINAERLEKVNRYLLAGAIVLAIVIALLLVLDFG